MGKIFRDFSNRPGSGAPGTGEEKMVIFETLLDVSREQLEKLNELLDESVKNRLSRERSQFDLIEQQREASRKREVKERNQKPAIKKAEKEGFSFEPSGGFSAGILFGTGSVVAKGLIGLISALMAPKLLFAKTKVGILSSLSGFFTKTIPAFFSKFFGLIFGLLPGKLKLILGKVVGGVLKVGFLAKAFAKLLPPAFIATTLFFPIRDAINEFGKTGSIKNAVLEFFGSLVNLLSFGLLNKDSVKSVTETFVKRTVEALKVFAEKAGTFIESLFDNTGISGVLIDFRAKIDKFIFGIKRVIEDTLQKIPGLGDFALTKEGEIANLERKRKEIQEDIEKAQANKGFLGIGKMSPEEQKARLNELREERRKLTEDINSRRSGQGTLGDIQDERRLRKQELERKLRNKSLTEAEKRIQNQQANIKLKAEEKSMNNRLSAMSPVPSPVVNSSVNNVSNQSHNFFSPSSSRNLDTSFSRNIDKDL